MLYPDIFIYISHITLLTQFELTHGYLKTAFVLLVPFLSFFNMTIFHLYHIFEKFIFSSSELSGSQGELIV